MAHKHKWICVDCHETKETASARPRAKVKVKNQPGYNHPACGCMLCQTYRSENMFALWNGALAIFAPRKPQWLELNRQMGAQSLESRESIEKRLDDCACGHSSQHHTADSLDNLLDCDMPGCACDHFHYQTDSSESEAA